MTAGLSELTWREYRRVFRKQRRATVESSIVVAELVGTVLWMAWELGAQGKESKGGSSSKEGGSR